ncbi:hypothetical protein V6N11_084330 [Hibiscus sabdariffa]|uniref:Uncharacterized protein n=1 Tax=Hibiscus sabdariffa TaxID=183260 RepID=A0ABR2QSV6_9ROSI
MRRNSNSFSIETNSGRPSDLMINPEAPFSLERHGSPVDMSNQRAAKKGRSLEVVATDAPLHEVEATEFDVSMMETGKELSVLNKEVSDNVTND